jgi:hypothetical protein
MLKRYRERKDKVLAKEKHFSYRFVRLRLNQRLGGEIGPLAA